MAEHIVVYGKGGVGTSTLVSNISAAMTDAGFKVLQVGCSSKADSCTALHCGFPVPTAYEILNGSNKLTAGSIVHNGFKGVSTIEIGSPGPSDPAFESVVAIIQREAIHADYVLYDLSGDNDFAGYYEILSRYGASRLYVVTTADFMSLRTVNRVFGEIDRLGAGITPIPFGGIIPNGISNSFEGSFIADFANKTSTHVLGRVPRSLMVMQCELYGKTVIEASPLSNQSYYYRRLANQLVDISIALPVKSQPRAMTGDVLREWAREWADRLFALENGLVSDGAAI